MIDWQSIETSPKNTLILLGTESDALVDTHMFFVHLGWSYGESWRDGFQVADSNDVIFPSHWAPITSPVEGAAVTHHKRGKYVVNR